MKDLTEQDIKSILRKHLSITTGQFVLCNGVPIGIAMDNAAKEIYKASMKDQRGKRVVKKCENCPNTFNPRVADVKRGWGRFCSKRCKAINQSKT